MYPAFPMAWFSIALRGYRDHPEPFRTYSPFPYNQLPELPVDAFDGTFGWLPVPMFGQSSNYDGEHVSSDEAILRSLEAQAHLLDLTIPPSFMFFMQDARLISRLRSPTGCSFDLPERLVAFPAKSGWLLRFFADSQGCLFWYLFLRPGAEHCVVVAYKSFGGNPYFNHDLKDKHVSANCHREDPPPDTLPMWYCAPHFESFLCRFWIENEIWYTLKDGLIPTNREQQEYLNHYRKVAS